LKVKHFLFLLLFLTIPFPRELFYNVFRHIAAIVPLGLSIPTSFYNKIAFFPAQLVLLPLIFLYRKHVFSWIGPSKYLILFALACFFSLAASLGSSFPLIYAHLFSFCLSLTVFPLLCAACDGLTLPLFVKRIAWSLVALALFEACICILQYFMQNPIGLKFLGEGSAEHVRFYVPLNYGRWIFDVLFHISRDNVHFFRAVGTFAHPNICGSFFFVSLLCTFYLYLNTNRIRAILLITVFVQIVALTMTFCRAAIIALFLCTLFWICLHTSSACKKLMLVFCVSWMICVTLFYPQLYCRGGLINYNAQVRSADAERLSYQNVAWKMVQERPLLGVGFDQFELQAHRFSSNGTTLPFKVHNIYFLIAAETGLVGAFLFLLFLFSILKRGATHLKQSEGIFLFILFIGLLLLGCCDFYLLTTPHCQILFLGIAALLYANTQKGIDKFPA